MINIRRFQLVNCTRLNDNTVKFQIRFFFLDMYSRLYNNNIGQLSGKSKVTSLKYRSCSIAYLCKKKMKVPDETF